jgi:hypothetical protein
LNHKRNRIAEFIRIGFIGPLPGGPFFTPEYLSFTIRFLLTQDILGRIIAKQMADKMTLQSNSPFWHV